MPITRKRSNVYISANKNFLILCGIYFLFVILFAIISVHYISLAVKYHEFLEQLLAHRVPCFLCSVLFFVTVLIPEIKAMIKGGRITIPSIIWLVITLVFLITMLLESGRILKMAGQYDLFRSAFLISVFVFFIPIFISLRTLMLNYWQCEVERTLEGDLLSNSDRDKPYMDTGIDVFVTLIASLLYMFIILCTDYIADIKFYYIYKDLDALGECLYASNAINVYLLFITLYYSLATKSILNCLLNRSPS